MVKLITLGMKCPRPLFEVSKLLKSLPDGETLEIVADDPAFKPDIEAWCRRTGNALVSLEMEGRTQTARVRKQGAP